MTILNWDHTMISTNNAAIVAEQLQQQGIIFKAGGVHEKWGTSNFLGYFGLNYIELITVADEKKASTITRTDGSAVYDAIQDFFAKKQRLNTIALRSSEIESTHSYLKKVGFPVSEIEEGKRVTPEGEVIKWKIFFINDVIETDFPYPFFIQWSGSDEQREKNLQENQVIIKQPAGKLLVKKAIFEIDDFAKIIPIWEKLLKQTATKKDENYEFTINDRKLVFVKGKNNHLRELSFAGANSELKGKQIKIDDIIFNF